MWNINLERVEQALFTKRWCLEQLTGESETIIALLCKAAPHLAADEWSERIAAGGVHINGLPVAADRLVSPPLRLEYFEPRGSGSFSTLYPAWAPEWIVYEDEDLIVINKPARLPTLPVREQPRHNVRVYLEAYLGRSVHLPSRLDTSTTGLVIASKSPRTHRALQHAFEHRQVEKIYRCELTGRPSFSRLITSSPIGRHPLHPVLRATHSEGKEAITTFTLLVNREESSLVEARPHTGRTHQIRVHSQAIGHPLVGDNFYNGSPASCLHLSCVALFLPHPLTRQPFSVAIPEKDLPEWARVGG